MKLSSKIRHTGLVLIIFTGLNATAQSVVPTLNPSELSLWETKRLWRETGNAAASGLDSIVHYSNLYIRHQAEQGSYHRPQQAASGNFQQVATKGNLAMGRFYVEGGFSYKRQRLNGINFNASLIDPFRGMPFLVADTNSSDWRNQYYDLDFTIASPRFGNHWSFGVEGQYHAAIGAKQRDIRSENYSYALYLRPSVMYHIRKHHLGASFIFKDTKEESSRSLVNTYVNQQYYTLLGLGHGISELGGSGDYNYEGNALGFGLHYEYGGERTRFIVSGRYSREAEDVNSSYSSPMPVGTVSRQTIEAQAILLKEDETKLHKLRLNFYNRDMNGIEYVVQRVNLEKETYWDILSRDVRSMYKTDQAGLDYTFYAKQNTGYAWKFHASIDYQKSNDSYLLAGSRKKIESLNYKIAMDKNITLKQELQQTLTIGIGGGYRQNLNGAYTYKGNFPEYPIVEQLEAVDLQWLKANVLALQIPIRYARQIKESAKAQIYMQGEGNVLHTNNESLKTRTQYQITLGVNF